MRQPKPAALAAPCPLSGKKKLWCSCATVSGSSALHLESSGDKSKVVEAAQDEASPTTLPGEPPKAKNLLLGEGQSLLWYSWYFVTFEIEKERREFLVSCLN